MFKPWMRKKAQGHAPLWFVLTCLVVFFLAACGNNGGTGSAPTPTTTPFKVTSVDLVVNPNSIAGKTCGSSASFTYTATFHIPAGTVDGSIQFMYTLNNGRSSTNTSVAVGPRETTKTFTFTSSGTLPQDHTYPGVAQVQVTSPNAVSSPQVIPTGACTGASAFKVTSVDLVVNPNSIAGKPYWSSETFTYTATFHIPAGSPGGTIQFMYTVNEGHSSTNASVTVGPGETIKTFTFTSSGMLLPDNTYPGLAGLIVTSPNAVSSPMVKPAGVGTQVPVFKVLTIDMAVSPQSITGTSCGSTIKVTYTATFHLVPNGPGGIIQFLYTWSNGRSSTNASVTVSPGQTIATYFFTWPGQATADHVYPGVGGVTTTSPNAVSSALVKPQGVCS